MEKIKKNKLETIETLIILGIAMKSADMAILSPSFLEITRNGRKILKSLKILKNPRSAPENDKDMMEIITMKKSKQLYIDFKYESSPLKTKP